MPHRFDIRFLRPIAEDEAHQVRNFIEDVWASAARLGWVDLASLDQHVTSMEDFVIDVPVRESDEAALVLSKLVAKHYMEHFVRIAHLKSGVHG